METDEIRKTAQFRLLRAHYFEGDLYLLGDHDFEDPADQKGVKVGAGTPYPVVWPTLEMEPLNEAAELWLAEERERLDINQASMNPIEDLPLDSYESNYVPGFNVRRKAPKKAGEPVMPRVDQ